MYFVVVVIIIIIINIVIHVVVPLYEDVSQAKQLPVYVRMKAYCVFDLEHTTRDNADIFCP